jgi:hypothetical protein
MEDKSHLGGWIDSPKDVEGVMKQLPFPVFSDVWTPIKDSGKNKTIVLTDLIEKVTGSFRSRNQTIGDCVSMCTALAVDIAKAVDIYIKGDLEEWIAETSTEDIYAGSRVIIGRSQLGNSDGSIGAWAAKWVNEYGALPRGKYGNVDISKYDGQRARLWGRANVGPPKTLIPLIKEHPILTTSLVKSYAEARDLIANGYPITVCSNLGFSNQRDKEGFAKPSGSWAHCMCVIGVRDNSRRPGVLIQNSWGIWNAGPKTDNQPDGSFWVDADIFEKYMLSQRDSWALSGYTGFEPKEINVRFL